MARRNYMITDEVIQRFATQGRGKGDGAVYKPGLTVFDFPSRGRIHRLYGSTVPREQFSLARDLSYQIMNDTWIRYTFKKDGKPQG